MISLNDVLASTIFDQPIVQQSQQVVTSVESPATPRSRSKRSDGDKKNSPYSILCKDRTYNPDEHCGVQLAGMEGPCVKSLTCKFHAIALRRAVPGRSRPLDELLSENRKERGLVGIRKASNRAKQSKQVSYVGTVAEVPSVKLEIDPQFGQQLNALYAKFDPHPKTQINIKSEIISSIESKPAEDDISKFLAGLGGDPANGQIKSEGGDQKCVDLLGGGGEANGANPKGSISIQQFGGTLNFVNSLDLTQPQNQQLALQQQQQQQLQLHLAQQQQQQAIQLQPAAEQSIFATKSTASGAVSAPSAVPQQLAQQQVLLQYPTANSNAIPIVVSGTLAGAAGNNAGQLQLAHQQMQIQTAPSIQQQLLGQAGTSYLPITGPNQQTMYLPISALQQNGQKIYILRQGDGTNQATATLLQAAANSGQLNFST